MGNIIPTMRALEPEDLLQPMKKIPQHMQNSPDLLAMPIILGKNARYEIDIFKKISIRIILLAPPLQAGGVFV